MAADFYAVLGVGRDANLSQINRAFRALTHGVDTNRGAEEGQSRLSEIQQAYETLMDTARRAEYERLLRQEEESARDSRRGLAAEPLNRQPMDLFGGFEHYRPTRDMLWDHWTQNFDERRAPKSRTVRDLNVEVVIAAEQALRGGVLTIDVPVGDVCQRCQGTGSTGYFACDGCDGHGMMWENQRVDVVLSPPIAEGMTLPVSLKHLGISNLYLNLHVRIAQ